MKTITTLLITILTCQSILGQFIFCDSELLAESYKITAESGLRLRVDQSLESKTIGLIPLDEEIKVCRENAKKEIINGLTGEWVKVFWRDREGYVFDRYIEKIKKNTAINLFSSQMDLVNDWKDTYFSKGQRLFGLYKTKHNREFELKKIELVESENPDYLKPLEETIPIWIFNKLELNENRNIKGKEINRMIYIGEKIGMDKGTIYGDGILNKADSIKIEGFKISPYELRFQYQFENKIYDELLLRMNCGGGIMHRYGYESSAVINFIGDLDGDKKDDILITFQSTFKGWNYGLFSTKYAQEGKMFKEIIVGEGSN